MGDVVVSEMMPGWSTGWSVTVAELKAAIKDLPDQTEVMISNADVGDIEIGGLKVETLLPATPESPALLVLEMGQILNYEYHYDDRLDAYLDDDKGHHWSAAEQRWRTRP